ncbi:Manganese transporter smf1 [Coemansia interrupta]|uniref:Sm protein F n=1 Tax=Coemansia interrupta TaxID=1126814 RepID=A0A9W8H5V6_9FUNG|nr:Manganese transporter smf1 [Coemansia interrupta]
MSFQPVNPKPFLQSLVGKPVAARLKWGQEYHGQLVSLDSYMNMQLINAEEFQDGNSTGELPGELLIRCNNVLYVRELLVEDKSNKGKVQDDRMSEDEGEEHAGKHEARKEVDAGAMSEDEQVEEGEA